MSVKPVARRLLRRLVRQAGYDLTPYPKPEPLTDEFRRLVRLLAHHRIDLVLDVGANSGQYARHLRRHGYRGRIVSFEPLGAAFADLQAQAWTDRLWEAVNFALGDRDGTATLHVAANSYSSSLRAMLPAHLAAAPHSAYVGTEQIPVHRLDSIARDYWHAAEHVFLKCDTQGFERNVLAGATRTLPRLTGVQLEMSLVPLYADEALFGELLAAMIGQGFELAAIEPEFCDEQTGQMLQVNGVFFRPPAG